MKVVLVYPHQLFEDNELLKKINKHTDSVFLVKDELYFKKYNFHKLKIALHTKTLAFYKTYLEEQNYKVKIVESLEEILNKNKINIFFVFDLVDDYLEKKINKICSENKILIETLETPMFLTTNGEIEMYIKVQKTHKKIFFMRNFYEWQRKKLNILIDESGKPVGGKWSFDEDNRKKIPKNIEIPKEIIFSDNFQYATNFKDAKKCVQFFLKNKLISFGPYEDAVLEKENILFHSVLTPYLNIGLLTPKYVVEETLKFAENHDVPLNSLEGFLRQIIGWREYMRLVYVKLGKEIRTQNYFNAQKQIPYTFWTGDTGILPIDNTVIKLISSAYSHHIPRLMIIGNFMNLCGFQPDQVYRWFMEMYIDSYDWVMVPNVYSMALYADGGMITSKPYISGSAYVLKMSDFKKGKKDDIKSWDKIWDALFWNFVGNHYDKLSKEGRLGFIDVQYKKMNEEKKLNFKKVAEGFLQSL